MEVHPDFILLKKLEAKRAALREAWLTTLWQRGRKRVEEEIDDLKRANYELRLLLGELGSQPSWSQDFAPLDEDGVDSDRNELGEGLVETPEDLRRPVEWNEVGSGRLDDPRDVERRLDEAS